MIDWVDHLYEGIICTKVVRFVGMDVGEWLRSVGLAEFEATFRENGIDADVLPELTDADLEKLGVLPRASETASQGDCRSERVRRVGSNSGR